MKLMKAWISIAIFAIIFVALAKAQDFDAAISRVFPSGVYFGLNADQLKATRQKIFEGPAASIPGSPQVVSNQFTSYMEIEGLGKPRSISYWYLLSENKVVGVLKITNTIGIDDQARMKSAQQLFNELTASLGGSQKESILRKGKTAFVPVRADVWKDRKNGSEIYFIATNAEITVAALTQSDFPTEQILIRPNAERFPLEKPADASIVDIDRGDVDKPVITRHSLQAQDNSDVYSVPSSNAKKMNQLTKEPEKSSKTAARSSNEHSFPSLIVVVAAVVVTLTLVVFYFKGRS
jgi:hypothetical protein